MSGVTYSESVTYTVTSLHNPPPPKLEVQIRRKQDYSLIFSGFSIMASSSRGSREYLVMHARIPKKWY